MLANDRYSYAINTNAVSYVDDSNSDDAYVGIGITPEIRFLLNEKNRLYVNYEWRQANYKEQYTNTSSTEKQTDITQGISMGWWHRWPANFATETSVANYVVNSNEDTQDSTIKTLNARSWYIISEHLRLITAQQKSMTLSSLAMKSGGTIP